MSRSTLQYLLDRSDKLGGGFLLLIDPDRVPPKHYLALSEAAEECGVDAILVGTSLSLSAAFGESVKAIKSYSQVPVILFPGSHAQITPDADAVLFTSLISGRNASYLIDEQVKGAPLVKQYGLEAIPTGYILVQSDQVTSVQYVSGTQPIPADKPDIACAHALAARYLGMKLVYLEAGSGSKRAVPVDMVDQVREYAGLPVMVGGGLRSPEECRRRIEAGASMVIAGSNFERKFDKSRLHEMTAAVHVKETALV